MVSAFACGAHVPMRATSASRGGSAALIHRLRPKCRTAGIDGMLSDRRAAAAAREGTRPYGAASHRQHNLPEMLVLAHMRLRRRGLIEREAAIDRQPELARGHRLPQISAHAAADLAHLLEGAGTKGHADIVDAPQGMEVEVEFGLHAGEATYIDDAAEKRRRSHGLRNHWP